MTMTTSARPTDFHRIARNGGENIWPRALSAVVEHQFLRTEMQR